MRANGPGAQAARMAGWLWRWPLVAAFALMVSAVAAKNLSRSDLVVPICLGALILAASAVPLCLFSLLLDDD